MIKFHDYELENIKKVLEQYYHKETTFRNKEPNKKDKQIRYTINKIKKYLREEQNV